MDHYTNNKPGLGSGTDGVATPAAPLTLPQATNCHLMATFPQQQQQVKVGYPLQGSVTSPGRLCAPLITSWEYYGPLLPPPVAPEMT